MNSVLDLIASHHSDRSFTDAPVDDAQLEAILTATQWAPTSANTQHVSVVVTRDAEARAKIAAIAGGQPWIAKAPVFLTLVMDHYKTAQAMKLAGEPHVIQDHNEGMISAATDAGILLGQLMLAARAEGLGVVAIGGIRNQAAELCALLKLPPLTFPVVGLCLGHVKTPAAQRPRLPHTTFRFDETYGTPDFTPAIKAYDEKMEAHWKAQGRAEGTSWSRSIAPYSNHNYRPTLDAALAAQGFLRTDKK